MEKSYHIENVKLTGYPIEDVIAVAEFAASKGIQVKIEGLPFGAPAKFRETEDQVE
jgi:hypothetical protein